METEIINVMKDNKIYISSSFYYQDLFIDKYIKGIQYGFGLNIWKK
jgi:hypothetical protein